MIGRLIHKIMGQLFVDDSYMVVAAGGELFLKITHLEKKHYLIGNVDWSHVMKALTIQTVF